MPPMHSGQQTLFHISEGLGTGEGHALKLFFQKKFLLVPSISFEIFLGILIPCIV